MGVEGEEAVGVGDVFELVGGGAREERYSWASAESRGTSFVSVVVVPAKV